MKQVKILVVVGLCLALTAILLYLRDPEPQPVSTVGGSAPLQQGDAGSQGGETQSGETQSGEQAATSQNTQEAVEQAAPEQANPDQAAPEQAAAETSAKTAEASPAESLSETVASQPGAQAEADGAAAGLDKAAGDAAGLPSFDIVRVEKDGSTLIAGRALPGAQVEVVIDADRQVAAARADQRGEFVALSEERLVPGQHELRLRSRMAEGEEWVLSEQRVVVVVPEKRPSGSDDGEPEAPMTVLLSKDKNSPSRVLQSPEGLGITSGDLGLEIIDYDEGGSLIVAGKAPSDSRLLVYLDNEPLADTKADAGGRWNVIPDQPVSEGAHRLRVDQIDDGGKVVARVETRFYRTAGTPDLAGEVTVEPGNSLWRIARRTYGEGIRYTLIYQANRGQIRDPDLIYPGQIFIIPEAE